MYIKLISQEQKVALSFQKNYYLLKNFIFNIIKGVAALRGIDLTIKEKEFVCIFGTSGGGKTTLLNTIGTIDKPTKGFLLIYLLKNKILLNF